MSVDGSPQLQAFATVAKDYVSIIDAREGKTAEHLLAQIEPQLLRLYSRILDVPLTFPPNDRTEDLFPSSAGSALHRSLSKQLGAFDVYRAIFDPYETASEAPVTGSLADDLADIYGDLRRGLERWEARDLEEATYEWRFGFEFHWGRHAASALNAIFALHFEHRWSDPPLAKRDA
jgi:hypothetical protein